MRILRTLPSPLVISYLCISFPIVHRLLVVGRRSCLLTASPDVKFLRFITLLTSFSHFGSFSSLPTSLWPGHIRFGHVFSIRTTYPYRFNILFSCLSKIVCVTRIFLKWLNFLVLVVWRSLHLFPKNPFWYLIIISLTCTPVSVFPNRNFKYFLSLYKIFFFFIYRNIFVSKVGYLVLL
jgi:hypothetical protein